jgi:DNA invertase Pin-like site-specific DNA recombinase
MKRAGIYGRNSSANEKSIADQLTLGRAAVSRNGWILAGEYSDDSSASRYRSKERDDWARLLADLTAGQLDVLVLWKSARGSRDEVDWFLLLRACRERGVLIHVMADRRSYDPRLSRDWKTLAEDGVASAYYSEELSENVRRGIREAAVAGTPHGRPSFGYDRKYDGDGRPLRVPNEHVPIVRELFDRLDMLTPISVLEKDFQARNLPSPRGKWSRRTIRVIAGNVAYIGKRLFDGEIRDAQWPAIVDEDVFWRVQQLLSAPERKTTRPGSGKYLLSYIAVSSCGGHVALGSRDRYGCDADGCTYIRRADADAVVTALILARLGQPDARQLYAQNDALVKAARAEADRYRVQLEEARRSFELPDGISAEALARKEHALLPLIQDADRRSRGAGVNAALDELIDADDKAAAWARLEVAARRQVVKTLARVVVGRPAGRLRRSADAGARLTEAAVRLDGSTWVGDSRTWRELGGLVLPEESA